MSERDELYLEHILEAIELIRQFTAEGRSAFMTDRKTQSAVMRQIEIIGEAAKNLGDSLKSAEPGVPWRDMAGMRDKLIHGYFSVKLDLVWNVIETDLGPLNASILRIVGKGRERPGPD